MLLGLFLPFPEKLARSREIFFGLKLIHSRVLMHTHTRANGDYITYEIYIIFKRGDSFKLINPPFSFLSKFDLVDFLFFLSRCFQITGCDSSIPATVF